MAKLTGRVVYIYPTQVIKSKATGNDFQKRDFVIAMQYFDRDTGESTVDETNTPLLTITGDRCQQLDDVRVGQMVTVTYGIRGRRYRDSDNKERIITDINVSSVVPIRSSSSVAVQQASSQSREDPAQENEADDLPF